MAENVPANVRGVPIVPVAVALLVGFSLGLAVSIAMDARAAKTATLPAFIPVKEPCADSAEKANKVTVTTEPEPAPSFTVPATATVIEDA